MVPVGQGDKARRGERGELNDPDGIRTRVAAVKGLCPGPLDDGAIPVPQEQRNLRAAVRARQAGPAAVALAVLAALV